MLVVGVAITQIPPTWFGHGHDDEHAAANESGGYQGVVGGHFSKSGSGVFNKVGVMLAFLYALISALASVYNEKLLKSDKGTMHAANVQLYLYGMAINVVGVLARSDHTSITYGMDKPLTWVIGFNMANTGLFIAALLKYHDSITKIGAGAVATILVYVFSIVVVKDQEFTAPFAVGACVCIVGVMMYQKHQTEKQ